MNQAADQPKPSSKKGFIHRFVVGTFAVAVAVKLVPSIEYTSWEQLLIASAVLGLLNAFVRPLLVIGCLPLLILTLGLFLVVINAGLFMLTAELVEGFEVPGFWPAVWGAWFSSWAFCAGTVETIPPVAFLISMSTLPLLILHTVSLQKF